MINNINKPIKYSINKQMFDPSDFISLIYRTNLPLCHVTMNLLYINTLTLVQTNVIYSRFNITVFPVTRNGELISYSYL